LAALRSPAIRSPSWMLLRLGLETKQHHAVADADRIALMESASPAEYRTRLTRIHGFETPIEAALSVFLDAALVRDHAKAHCLRHDFETLGLTAKQIDMLPQFLPRITSLPQAFGWLFVIERHTLVSGLIRRQLAHRFGAELHDATAYLAAYGDAPGARFRSLCSAIDEYATQHAAYPTLIVAAACEAFRAQRQWYLAPPSEREARIEPVGLATDRSSVSS
jgi:heme oxygenase